MSNSKPSVLTQSREMSLSLADFERLLPKVESIKNINKNNNLYSFYYKDEMVEINLERFSERKIAALTLPVIFLRFDMHTENNIVFDEFMDSFFKTFQRGGG